MSIADNKNWADPYKIENRENHIIGMYKHIFNKTSIPKDKQYWGLFGKCATDEGLPKNETEISHVVGRGLTTIRQMRGVECDSAVFNKNRLAYPAVKFYKGCFESEMAMANARGEFNPAIINFDSMEEPQSLIPQVLLLMTYTPPNTMVVCNMVANRMNLSDPRRVYSEERILQMWDDGLYEYGFDYNPNKFCGFYQPKTKNGNATPTKMYTMVCVTQ